MDVAFDLFEPLHTVACGALQLEGFDLALGLVLSQRRGHVAWRTAEDASEGYSVFHGEFCSGADAEVGGVGGVADENDVFVMPFFAEDALKLEPDGRPAEMFGVGKEG